jgi:two-component system sensor histidine kinase UhpB
MYKEALSYRLLVVEDNPGDFVLLKTFLRNSGLPVGWIEHASDMTATADIVKRQEFDLALLDLSLPDSTGIDSVIALNRLLPKTPIIVLSGLSTIEVATEAIALGAQDYLIKGEFNEKLLAKSIQYAVERKKTIRHLQESNERFRYVNRATQDTIWEWDFKTAKGTWGEGLIKTYGYGRDDQAYDENWAEKFVHPSDKENVLQTVTEGIKAGTQNWQSEYRFRCADGTYKEVFDRAYILYDEKGLPDRMIGAMTDLTEKKELEKELLLQQIRQQKLLMETSLQAQEKERTELGRELHDNINQILATIKMYLGMAKTGKKYTEDLLEKSYEYVNDVMEEIRKLSHSLVAPSLGEIGLETALKELIEGANIVHGLHTFLQVDKVFNEQPINKNRELMLYRVVQEQMSNINKYAQASEVKIHLTASGGRVELSIEDNGLGFDPTVRSKGIGLKNIKNRVDFYAGSMTLVSAPGRGCKLAIAIPVTDKTES